MKNLDKLSVNTFEPIFILVNIFFIMIFSSCSTPELRVSEFKFVYNHQNYIVRSAYCPGNPESCNQLIGNKFVAVDMNQDRIIDKINKGSISLTEAQEIYDYCLTILEKKNKLSEVNRKNKIFSLIESNYNYEIKSFYPKGGSSFNEFTIVDKRSGSNYKTSILIDNGADGVLDELLKGGMMLKGAQLHYNKVIVKGLESKDLKKINGLILIR